MFRARPPVLRGLALVIVLLSCHSVSTPATEGDERLAGLIAELERTIRSHPGFFGAVLVELEDRVILDRGYGADAAGRTIEPDTPFWIASISKQFTASAILGLQEDGTLSLDDPIIRFFDEVPPDKRGITVRQLLEHTSGLGNNYAADGIADRSEAVAAILATELEHRPGEGFRYSGDNYALLAAIIEVGSGESYERHMRRLFELAGMSSTTFWGSDFDSVAAIERDLQPEIARPNWGYRGGTGLASTTHDLLKWVRSLARARVIARESVEEMLRPNADIGGDRWHGYGWFTSIDDSGDRTLWTRGYEDTGHGGYIAVDPAWRWTVIVVSSSGAGNGEDGFPLTHVIGPELASIVRTAIQTTD